MEERQRQFINTLPYKPYAVDVIGDWLSILTRLKALKYRHIQVNSPSRINYLCFDIDHDNGLIWTDEGLPAPTYQMFNTENGHSHLLDRLEIPIDTTNKKSM